MTYQRNPFMATFATNSLHYRGIGSGIVRILEENKNVVLENDEDSKEFKVTIKRDDASDTTQKTTQKTTQTDDSLRLGLSDIQKLIIDLMTENPGISRKELAERIDDITEDGIKYNVRKLQKLGLIKRVEPDYSGHWEVVKK